MGNGKKILLLTAFPPNNKTAGQDYTQRLLEDLSMHGYIVDLIYFSYKSHEAKLPSSVNVLHVEKFRFSNIFLGLPFHPFFSKRFSIVLLMKIQKIAKNYDFIYFDFSQMFIYSLFIDHPKKIFMCHDVISQKYQRQNMWQLPWIIYSEKRLLNSARYIFVFSKKDAWLISKLFNLEARSVNFYLKNSPILYNNEFAIFDKTFCFYGAWNRKENWYGLLWFIKNVYPYTNKKYSYRIIGGGLNKKLCKIINGMENFVYLGFIDDPIYEIAKSQALIAPLFAGAGVKVKVVDTFSTGTPVIGTEIAFEGLLNTGNLFNIVTNKEDFIKAINDWKEVPIKNKIVEMNLFYNEYNKNHLLDILS